MRPGRGADAPSCLAMNPRNREASASRRVTLLAAFSRLSEDDQADLLEAVESLVGTAQQPGSAYHDEARRVIHLVYAAAGWDDGRPRS